jgi:SAM-dependent methyltransferase
MKFTHPDDSHKHSLQVLDALYEYDDFMASIQTLVDLGCGSGEDLAWWATRTTRDDNPEPLNIQCVGVDLLETPTVVKKYPNITYQRTDFEKNIHVPNTATKAFDVLWCHDAFQYCTNPLGTLAQWWNMTTEGGMLAITLPQTTLFQQRKESFHQPSGCYYHHTIVSLIHMLAVTGWDCREGFFLKQATDSWLSAIVYKSKHAPMDPKTTTWYQLSELELLPESADKSIGAHGYLRQQDLLVPWIDKSLSWLGQQ